MAYDILTADEVAQLMRVSRDTVYRLVARGELPGRKVGRAWRFSRAAIQQHLSTVAPSSEGFIPDSPTLETTEPIASVE